MYNETIKKGGENMMPYKNPISTPFVELDMLNNRVIEERGYKCTKIRIVKWTTNEFQDDVFTLPGDISGGNAKKYLHKTKCGGTKIEFTTKLNPVDGLDKLKDWLVEKHDYTIDQYYVRELELKHIETGKVLWFQRGKSTAGANTMSLLLKKIDKVDIRNMLEEEVQYLAEGFCGNEHCIMEFPDVITPSAKPTCRPPIV